MSFLRHIFIIRYKIGLFIILLKELEKLIGLLFSGLFLFLSICEGLILQSLAILAKIPSETIF